MTDIIYHNHLQVVKDDPKLDVHFNKQPLSLSIMLMEERYLCALDYSQSWCGMLLTVIQLNVENS